MKIIGKFALKLMAVAASLLVAHKLHADEPRATVWAKHPDAVKKFFPADTYRMLDAADEEKQFDEQGYILPQKRDAIFHKVGIEDKLTNLDEMDKDMLVMTARFEDAKSVKKHYPMLTDAQVNALVAAVMENHAK